LSEMKYVPMSVNELGIPSVRIEMEDGNVNAAIDTGQNSFIELQTTTFEKLVASGAITRIPDSDDSQDITAAGSFKSHMGRFTRGNVLGIDLHDVPVVDGRNADLLGLSFLVHFNFVCDLTTQCFYFERRRGEPPINDAAMIGAWFIYPGGHCRVLGMRHGPAEDAGLRINDAILKLGPLRGRELNAYSIYDLCETRAGQTIDVEYSRAGKEKTFKTQLKLLEKRFTYPPQQ